MQQNEIYNIPLPRGPGPKNKTGNESGINYPGELKTLNSTLRNLDRSSQGVFVSKN
jgi:hypothetical protein